MGILCRGEQKGAFCLSTKNLREEHEGTEGEFEGIFGSEYEGRRGASPREMMALIASASENQKWLSLSPLSILEEIEDFIKDTSVHDFLRLAVDNGFHDCKQFVSDVKTHYLQLVKREIFDSFSYVEEGEFDRLFSEYFYCVKAHELGESIPKNTTAGFSQQTSTAGFSQQTSDVMSDIEKKLEIKDGIEEFRSSLLSRIGAYATENPNLELDYSQVFPEIYNTLKQSFWDSRSNEIHESLINILKSFSDERSTLSKSELEAVENSLQFLKDRYNYDENSARDIVGFIVSQEK